MKPGWLALVPSAAAALVVWYAAGRAPGAAPAPAISHAPPVVLLEGPPDGDTTDVVVRTPGAPGATLLGRVTHAPGSARRGVVLPAGASCAALLVVAEREARGGSTYDSALYRVEGGRATRLAGGLTNASSALVTAHGTVLVQRGREGAMVDLAAGAGDAPRALRERTDALALDAVDPATGATRTVWSGAGQIAFLAAALGGDEVAVYHVSDGGARLFALDAGTGAVRPLGATSPQPALMRDFSRDATRDALVFARAAQPGAAAYQIAAVPAHGAAAEPRVLFEAPSDHLMPRALRDGAIAFALPGDRGLGLLPPAALDGHAPAQPIALAPVGAGADAVVGETVDGRFLAVRHTEPQREALAVVERASGRAAVVGDGARLVEFAGFAPAATGSAP